MGQELSQCVLLNLPPLCIHGSDRRQLLSALAQATGENGGGDLGIL